MIEGMIALSRVNAPNNALPIFLTLSEIDRERSPERRLSSATVRLLADKFPQIQPAISDARGILGIE